MEKNVSLPAKSHGKSIKEVLERHGFRFSKSLGQNFLVDPNIPEKIVRLSDIDGSCSVLEIGPGIGALTLPLCRAAGFVTAVELDTALLPILSEVLSEQSNVVVVRGDILRLSIAELVNEQTSGLRRFACANLPYNITTPAISALIDSGVFESITVMVQREVARRICAGSADSDYGAFSVYINYHSMPEILFDVPPECFMPRPNVHSSVVKIKMRKEPLLQAMEEPKFFKVVRAAFGQRRKTLVNALYAVFGSEIEKNEIAKIVESCGFDAKIRGETLGLEDFIKLSSRF